MSQPLIDDASPAGSAASGDGASDPARPSLGRLILHPATLLVVGACIPPLISVMPDDRTYQLLWRTPRYITREVAIEFAAIGIVVAMVAWATSAARWSGFRAHLGHDAQLDRLAHGAKRLLQISAISYVGWTAIAVTRGLSITAVTEAFTGSPGALSDLKDSILRPIPGLSTSSQFAGLGIGAGLLVKRLGRDLEPIVVRLIPVVALFTLVRSFMYAERLALLELAIPSVAVLVFTRGGRSRASRRASIIAIPGVLVLFLTLYAVQEYYRSWTPFYRDEYHGPFAQFAAERLSGYYATAVNNAVIFDRFSGTPRMWTVTEPFRATLGDDLVYGRSGYAGWELTLERYGNPELNNYGGFFAVMADTGVLFPVLVLSVAVVLGTSYRSAAIGSNLAAIPGYGALCVAALEFSRIPYPFLARGMFPSAGALILMFYVKGTIGRAPPGHPRRSAGQARRAEHGREPHLRDDPPPAPDRVPGDRGQALR